MKTKEKRDGSDSLDELVSRIEVARQVCEYDWELLCGPYADIEHATIARDDRRRENKGDNIQIIAFIDC